VELARESDKRVLAEGIETEAEKAVMDELGVDLYQGFFFAKPSPEPVTSVAVGSTF
jgi:EAL domain-containing protein (putative c-di-GMP-specific phosphodiesterase class I)